MSLPPTPSATSVSRRRQTHGSSVKIRGITRKQNFRIRYVALWHKVKYRTDIAIFWNTDNKYRTDLKKSDRYTEKPTPAWNTYIDTWLLVSPKSADPTYCRSAMYTTPILYWRDRPRQWINIIVCPLKRCERSMSGRFATQRSILFPWHPLSAPLPRFPECPLTALTTPGWSKPQSPYPFQPH